MTLLMIAARDGSTEIVSALLKHGADVDKQDVSIRVFPPEICGMSVADTAGQRDRLIIAT